MSPVCLPTASGYSYIAPNEGSTYGGNEAGGNLNTIILEDKKTGLGARELGKDIIYPPQLKQYLY